ncbi:large ribosomal subunit protein eL36-like [Ochotona princeps]|uniref:large ribosomal subunit protein eL36-like n=1 Tax=Ochotona princeps TaxID=9978 RepID=UPI0027155F03|nr:large ribosomal subunit protein eL36-like [Ochotona princeps]
MHCPVAIGLSKGHKVTKNMSKPRHSHHHRHLTNHTKVSQDMIWQVCNFTWYECCVMELLRVSKFIRFIKKRIGTHIKAKRKQEELSSILATGRKGATKRDYASLST